MLLKAMLGLKSTVCLVLFCADHSKHLFSFQFGRMFARCSGVFGLLIFSWLVVFLHFSTCFFFCVLGFVKLFYLYGVVVGGEPTTRTTTATKTKNFAPNPYSLSSSLKSGSNMQLVCDFIHPFQAQIDIIFIDQEMFYYCRRFGYV